MIDSAIDEAREIFEHKDNIKNETVEEKTSTEEIPEQAAKETDSNSDATFSEVSKELEDNQFFANFIEHCISVSMYQFRQLLILEFLQRWFLLRLSPSCPLALNS